MARRPPRVLTGTRGAAAPYAAGAFQRPCERLAEVWNQFSEAWLAARATP